LARLLVHFHNLQPRVRTSILLFRWFDILTRKRADDSCPRALQA